MHFNDSYSIMAARRRVWPAFIITIGHLKKVFYTFSLAARIQIQHDMRAEVKCWRQQFGYWKKTLPLIILKNIVYRVLKSAWMERQKTEGGMHWTMPMEEPEFIEEEEVLVEQNQAVRVKGRRTFTMWSTEIRNKLAAKPPMRLSSTVKRAVNESTTPGTEDREVTRARVITTPGIQLESLVTKYGIVGRAIQTRQPTLFETTSNYKRSSPGTSIGGSRRVFTTRHSGLQALLGENITANTPEKSTSTGVLPSTPKNKLPHSPTTLRSFSSQKNNPPPAPPPSPTPTSKLRTTARSLKSLMSDKTPTHSMTPKDEKTSTKPSTPASSPRVSSTSRTPPRFAFPTLSSRRKISGVEKAHRAAQAKELRDEGGGNGKKGRG